MLVQKIQHAADGFVQRLGQQFATAVVFVAEQVLQRQREHVLAVGIAAYDGEAPVGKAFHQRPANFRERRDVAVVHERERTAAKRVTIVLGHVELAAGGRAHMGHDAAAARHPCQLGQVGIVPGRRQRAKAGRLGLIGHIPDQAEAVPVQRLGPLLCMRALVDQ